MDSIEKIMIQVILELSKNHAPVVFKGAMTLKIALQNQKDASVSRITRDVDGDWIALNTSMQEMEAILSKAVKAIDDTLTVLSVRSFAEGKSAGFRVRTAEGTPLFGMDLSVRENPYNTLYFVSFKDESGMIRGALLEKMLVDKIRVISTRKVFRRVKDIVDVYILSSSKGIKLEKIQDILQEYKNDLGNFSAFIERKDDLEHAYEKLKGITNKPSFSEVYTQVKIFLMPFIQSSILQHKGGKEASKPLQHRKTHER